MINFGVSHKRAARPFLSGLNHMLSIISTSRHRVPFGRGGSFQPFTEEHLKFSSNRTPWLATNSLLGTICRNTRGRLVDMSKIDKSLRGFIRDEISGNCVGLDQCPECPKNEFWQSCYWFDEKTCSTNQHATVEKDPQRLSIPCKGSGCRCDPGLVRHNGICVGEEVCPRECPLNQEWKTCGRKCEPSCANRSPECHKICTPPKVNSKH